MSHDLRAKCKNCPRNSVFYEDVFIPNLLSFSNHTENGFTIEGACDRIFLYLHLSSTIIPEE